MEPRYRLVFTGQLKPGYDPDSIVEALAERFHLRESAARALIAAAVERVLKSDLDGDHARRYRAALDKVGLVVEVRPEGGDAQIGARTGAKAEFPAEAARGIATASDGSEPLRPGGEPDHGADALGGVESKASKGPWTLALEQVESAWVDSRDLESGPRTEFESARASAEDLAAGPIANPFPPLAKRPEEVPAGATSCPKCGAIAVSPLTGVCQSCGVVAERYLARRVAHGGDAPPGPDGNLGGGAGSDSNPYAPPRADLTPAPSELPADTLTEPKRVPAGRGWSWVASAWNDYFKPQPWGWMGALALLLAVNLVLGLVPGGSLAGSVLGPVLTGGLMIGAQVQHGGGRFEVAHLFAGFSRNGGRLALVGLGALGFSLLIGLVIGVAAVAAFGVLGFGIPDAQHGVGLGEGLGNAGMDPAEVAAMGPWMLLAVLFAALLAVPVAMAMIFAPALVALDEVPVLRAFKLSFVGCWRNILPFTVFTLVAIGLVLVGAIPLGLGLLIVVPLLTIAMYVAYRDIYYER